MSSPLVTVGIPFWNEERWLAHAVTSILRQTANDLELILADDGSTDRSLAIAKAFRDPRVRVLSDGAHRGLSARLNQIADQARGAFMARMDADDVSHPDRIRQQLALIENGVADAVGTWAALIDDQESPFAVVEDGIADERPIARLRSGRIAHATLLARREWFLRHRYDETLTRVEDLDLWHRSTDTRFVAVRRPLYVVRVEAATASFVHDYAESQRANRALFRRYGPRAVGWTTTLRASAASVMKEAAMRLAGPLGLVPAIVKRRGRAPTSADRALIDEALRSAEPDPAYIPSQRDAVRR